MSKFNPIFDAMDSENYDFAIKICNKALKKSPDSADSKTIMGLKALAMARSGFYQPAYELAIQVKNMNPTDPHAIQALFLTLKILHMRMESFQLDDEIIDLYKTAYSNSPTNEEWANHWFMAVARKGDWKQLQMAAVKLKQDFKDQKYYFWMCMTIYIQVTYN